MAVRHTLTAAAFTCLLLGLVAGHAAAATVVDPLEPVAEEVDEVTEPLPLVPRVSPVVEKAGGVLPPAPSPASEIAVMVESIVEDVLEEAEPVTEPVKEIVRETARDVDEVVNTVVPPRAPDQRDPQAGHRQGARRFRTAVAAGDASTAARTAAPAAAVSSGIVGPGVSASEATDRFGGSVSGDGAAGVDWVAPSGSAGGGVREAAPFVFSGLLVVLMLVFLVVQNRIDGNDPRLRDDEDVLFV